MSWAPVAGPVTIARLGSADILGSTKVMGIERTSVRRGHRWKLHPLWRAGIVMGRCRETANGCAGYLSVPSIAVTDRHEGLIVVLRRRFEAGYSRREAAIRTAKDISCESGRVCQRTAACSDSESRILRV